MNKEELIKEAWEWEYNHFDASRHSMDRYEFAANFHIHQTKKMLESWTDERIKEVSQKESFINATATTVGKWWKHLDGKKYESIKWFRDELLKQLK